MNYILRKMNCKAFIGAVFAIVLILLCSVRAYAAYTMKKIPNFWFDKKYVFVAENISPRSSDLSSVNISYDSLADLVYYCNEHGLSTSLVYNSAISKYVGFVNDTGLDIKNFGVTSLHGLLGNVDGKVYVAERTESGDSTIYNIYNFVQTTINEHTMSSGSTPTTPVIPSTWTDHQLLEKIYDRLYYLKEYASIANGYLSNLGWIAIDIRNYISDNVVPALSAINSNISSFMTAAVSGLDGISSRLTSIQSASWASVDVENRIYSGLSDISQQLGSVITNGAVQINATSLESRLDKLISMYRKVNSVVLDTASINYGIITDAVGGELAFAKFWGKTVLNNTYFLYASNIAYDVASNAGMKSYQIANVPLRSVSLGSSIPSYISASDDLSGGVWRDTSSASYVISDTFIPSSGKYMQRVKSTAYDGTENWRMVDKDGITKLFFCADTAFENISANLSCWASDTGFTYAPFSAAFGGAATEGASAYAGQFSVWQRNIRFMTAAYATVEEWKAHLAELAEAGTPLTVLFVPTTAESTDLDSAIIQIPGGTSTLNAPSIRVTGQYETYESFTKTADIIAAIDRINMGGGDMTAVTSRLDRILAELQNTSGSASCEHTYEQHMEQEATCTLPGLLVSTCTKCGDSSSEIVDPLGHDWILTKAADYGVAEDTEVVALAAASSETSPATFWESVYQRRSDGGFGSSGFGDSGSWSSAEEMASAYDAFAAGLPASGYDSAGTLLWQPKWIEDASNFSLVVKPLFKVVVSPAIDGYYAASIYSTVTYSGTAFSFSAVQPSTSNSTFGNSVQWKNHSFSVPVEGDYSFLASPCMTGQLLLKTEGYVTLDEYYSAYEVGFVPAWGTINIELAAPWNGTNGSHVYAGKSALDGRWTLYTPVFQITPADASVSANYASSTRPHNFDDTTIIDETANTFYDMAAGSTYTMSKWSYDYPTRTYTVTLEDETTVTVQYGDQAMIVTNGAAANSYPYSVPSGGGTDPDPGPDTPSAFDVYTCSRCGRTYEDRTGNGAPDEDYSTGSISQLVVRVFSKLGTFAGKLIGFLVHLFDKALGSVDHVISKFNEYTAQISGFGGDYPVWLTGFWAVLPSELQVALTFAVLCMVLGVVGKKLFFS